ncbi:MAG: hypothetical protein WC343_13545 [Bacilli bacterium]|jgi:hypothetical protein
MQYCTRNPAIKKPELSDAASIIDINDNMDVIDGIICKSNFNGATDPGVGDDIVDGYAVGSHWWNVTDHRLFVAESVATGAAVWRQVYPSKWSMNEVPSGTINGVNVTFTILNTPIGGQIMLYLNGQYMTAGAGEDYTISGSTITMAAPLIPGDKIRTNYQY